MNIIFYAPNYVPATRYGGPIQSSHGLTKALVELGHQVTVFTTNVDGPGVLNVPIDRVVKIDGVDVRYFPTTTPRRLYYSPMMMRALQFAAADADIIHVNGMFLWPGSRAAYVADRSHVPHIVAPRGMLVPELVSGKSTVAKRLWIEIAERRALELASRLHVTSELEAVQVSRLGLNLAPFAVVPNGVDLPTSIPAREQVEALWCPAPAGRRVAFLGRLDWTKGVEIAIDAVARLPETYLWIAGPDQIGLRAELEARAKSAGVAPFIRFLGPLDDERKWALLAGADVLVVPSISESFGMAAGEALAAGVPVVCTEGVGASEIIRILDAGCVVNRSAAALASSLGILMADTNRMRAYGLKAAAYMKDNMTWKAIGQRMQEVYRQSIDEYIYKQHQGRIGS